MSVRQRPLLHEVIPIMDLLDTMLDQASSDLRLKPAVRLGAALGQAVLNKYYARTDDSIMYRCVMSMYIALQFLRC